MNEMPNPERTPCAPDLTPPVDDPTVPRQQVQPPEPQPEPDEARRLHPRPAGRPEGVVSDPDAGSAPGAGGEEE
jgi:hypothetical protein